MQVNIKGKNVEVTDRLKSYVDKKIGKLDHYLPGITEAWVELRVEDTKAAQDRQVCQVTLRTDRTILRAEERSDDIFTAIDAVLTKIYRQIDRYKGKRKTRWRSTSASAGTDAAEAEIEEEEEAEGEAEIASIVRVKRFEVRPVTPEEAIEQMELLGHDFYVFYNAEAGQINVLYRRKDGNYGLLQPELD
jgi:putative sigma-54 modulation protein